MHKSIGLYKVWRGERRKREGEQEVRWKVTMKRICTNGKEWSNEKATNYLNIKNLLYLTYQTMVDIIKLKTPKEEILKTFNMKNDFILEEEEGQKENQWIFEWDIIEFFFITRMFVASTFVK